MTKKIKLRAPCASAILTFALATVAGMLAHAHVIVGGFAGDGVGERVEEVAGLAAAQWLEEAGAGLEVKGTFVQHEAGEASVVIRMFDSKRPVVLAWHGAAGFQCVRQGGLAANVPEVSTASGPQVVKWRLRARGVNNAAQWIFLEVQNEAGEYVEVFREQWVLQGVREWLEGAHGKLEEVGGILTVGIAGPVALRDTQVRVARDGTVLLVY